MSLLRTATLIPLLVAWLVNASASEELPSGTTARLGTLRHGTMITAATFSPDGQRIASGDWHGGISVWETATGKELQRFETGLVASLAFSPDGKTLAAGASYCVRLWDLATAKLRWEVSWAVSRRDIAQLPKVAWSSDGKYLAVGNADNVLLLDSTGEVRQRFRALEAGSYGVTPAFTPDGLSLAVTGLEEVALYDVATGNKLSGLGRGGRNAARLAISPDGKYLACWPLERMSTKTVQIRDLTGKALHQFEHEYPAGFLAFPPDGKTLLVSANGESLLRDLGTGNVKRRFAKLVGIALSPDGKLLLVGAGGTSLQRWDLTTQTQIRLEETGHASVSSLVLAPNGRDLALGDAAGNLFLYEWSTRRLLQTCSMDKPAVGLAFSPDSKRLACSGPQVTLRELPAAGVLRRSDVPWGKVSQIAYAPDGQLLATADWLGPVRIWDADTLKVLYQMEAHQGGANCVAISADGKTIASGDRDGTIFLGDIHSGRTLREVAVPRDRTRNGDIRVLSFSGDGKVLAGGIRDHTIRLWDVATGRELRPVKTGPDHGFTRALAFSPDDRTLAAGGSNPKHLWLWEVATGEPRIKLDGHRGPISALTFSADGKVLASGSDDTTVLFWELARLQPAGDLSAKGLESIWSDLAGADAQKAFAAVNQLVTAPGPAMTLLREKFRPAARVDSGRIVKLIGDLESNDFATRQRATEELEHFAEQAEAELQKTLATRPALDVTHRIEGIRNKVRQTIPTGDRVREIRAIEVLQRMGTPEAKALLEVLGGGAPECQLTSEAQKALAWLARRN